MYTAHFFGEDTLNVVVNELLISFCFKSFILTFKSVSRVTWLIPVQFLLLRLGFSISFQC